MKFGFGFRIGIIVGIVLLSCGYLGMGYAGAVSDYDASMGQISITLEALKKSAVQQGGKSARDLQGQIDRAAAELKRAQSIYPATVDKTKTIGVLLDIAASKSIVISVVSCSESVKKTEERAYPVTSLGLQIEGSYECILDFLSALEVNRPEARQEWLTSLAVDSVNLSAKTNRPETSTDEAVTVTIGGAPLPVTAEKYEGRIVVVAYGTPELIPKKTPVSTSKTQPKTK